VYGWTMRGKTGRISQEHEDGRGIITEYMIQFLNSDGNWTFINNSRTGKEVCSNTSHRTYPPPPTHKITNNRKSDTAYIKFDKRCVVGWH
jgi:hypothetical protein